MMASLKIMPKRRNKGFNDCTNTKTLVSDIIINYFKNNINNNNNNNTINNNKVTTNG